MKHLTMMEMLTKKKIGRMLGEDAFATPAERQLALYAYEMWARVNAFNCLITKYQQQGERVERVRANCERQKDAKQTAIELKGIVAEFEKLELQRREILNIT